MLLRISRRNELLPQVLPSVVQVIKFFNLLRKLILMKILVTGVGTAIMSPLIEQIIFRYGWKRAMLMISALILNCALFGWLFRPVPLVENDQPNDNSGTEVNSSSVENEQNSIELKESKTKSEMSKQERNFLLAFPINQNQLSTKSSIEINIEEDSSDDDDQNKQETNDGKHIRSNSFSPGFLLREDSFYSGSLMNIANHKAKFEQRRHSAKKTKNIKNCFLFKRFNFSDEIMENLSEMIDLSLMRNYIFLIFSISNFLTSIGYHIPYIYLKVSCIN